MMPHEPTQSKIYPQWLVSKHTDLPNHLKILDYQVNMKVL